MAKYRVTVPFQDDMGSVLPFTATSSLTETAVENALRYINRMRDHDGLRHLTMMPLGTKFERVKDGRQQ